MRRRWSNVPNRQWSWPPPALRQAALAEAKLSKWAFEPCTGAISPDVAQQLTDAASTSGAPKADVVTLSMGGNDIFFADVIKGCIDVGVSWDAINPGCDQSEQDLKRRVDMLAAATTRVDGEYQGVTLPLLYDEIGKQVRPGGSVVVLGYPQIVEETGRWDGWRRNLLHHCEGVEDYDVSMLRSVAGYLNFQIALAVKAADERWASKGVRFHWRDIATGVYETGDAADQRHALCSAQPWINGQTTGVGSGDWQFERSFHPMQEGHTETGNWLAGWMRTDLDFASMGPPPAPRSVMKSGRTDDCRIGSLAEYWPDAPYNIAGYSAVSSAGSGLTHYNINDSTTLLLGGPGEFRRVGVEEFGRYLNEDGEDARTFVMCSLSDPLRWIEPAFPVEADPDRSVALDGAGPANVGASPREISLALGRVVEIDDAWDTGGECVYYGFTSLGEGVGGIGTDDVLHRIDVTEGQWTTKSGVGVGSTANEVLAAYPDKIEVTQHTYVPDGNYLSYRNDAGEIRMVFETDDNRVTRYRVGRPGWVEMIEGCA